MKMKSVGLVLAGAVSATVLWQAFSGAIAASNSDTYKQLNLFGDVFDRVRSDYVEPPDEEKMIEAAINGMLTSLDPHSSYMNAKDVSEDMQVPDASGEFGGLGIEVTMENELVKVMSPRSTIRRPPSAGVLAGDLIIEARRRRSAGPEAQRGGRQDARRGEYADQADGDHARAPKEAARAEAWCATSSAVKSVKFEVEGPQNDVGYLRIISFTEQTL
jgi:carboxyl-terminal processing protease